MPAKKRRQRSGQQVQTSAAQAKARDQETIRQINQALADGQVPQISSLPYHRCMESESKHACQYLLLQGADGLWMHATCLPVYVHGN